MAESGLDFNIGDCADGHLRRDPDAIFGAPLSSRLRKQAVLLQRRDLNRLR